MCGDGEFIIYTALAWRNKSYGSALEFVWTDSGDYATRESGSKIKTFKNFKEKNSFTPPFNTEGLYGGPSAFFFSTSRSMPTANAGDPRRSEGA